MNDSNRKLRNSSAVVGHDRHHRHQLPAVRIDRAGVDQWAGRTGPGSPPAPTPPRRWRRAGWPSARCGNGARRCSSSPDTRRCAKPRRWWSRYWREVQLPHLIRPRWAARRTRPCGARRACGVPAGRPPAPIRPSSRSNLSTVASDTTWPSCRTIAQILRWPHGRMRQRMGPRPLTHRMAARLRPRAFHRALGPGTGLPASPRPFRSCRSDGRTSRSTCPPLCGSPRGRRRAQPALGGQLRHPDLDRGLTKGLGQLDNLGLQLFLAA